jgi:hypothetical protein
VLDFDPAQCPHRFAGKEVSGRTQNNGELTMKAAYWIGTIAVLAVLSSGAASSDPKKLHNLMASQEEQLVRGARDVNKACGTALKVKFDWTGVKEDDLFHYSAAGYCEAALDGIRQVCRDPSGKDAVGEKIKSVTCGFGASRDITLKDGAVSYKINFNSANDADFVYEALENAL